MQFSEKHLRIFRAVMIHGGATGASAEVGLTQPAVSRILKEFEAMVGFRLFVRERTGLRPTREAELLFRDVQRAHLALTQVEERAQAIRNRETGHLRLAAIAVDVDGVLSRNLSMFLKAHPGIRLEMTAATKPEIEKLVAGEQVDLGLVTLPIGKLSDRLDIHDRFNRTAVAILPRSHPLANEERVPIAELMAHGLIQLVTGSPLRMQIEAACAEQGLDLDCRVEVETQRALVNLVLAGAGTGIVDSLILSDTDRSGVVIKPLTDAIEWQVAAVSARHVPLSNLAGAFLDWLPRILGDGQAQ